MTMFDQIATIDRALGACYHPSDNHSKDRVAVHYGAGDPMILCGYHASWNLNDVIWDIENRHECEPMPKGMTIYNARITGQPLAECANCSYKCAYGECACDLEHDCEEED